MKGIGIYFGVSACSVAIYDNKNGYSKCLPVMGKPTVPSIIWINSDGEILVGDKAKGHIIVCPTHSIVAPIRDLGSDETYNINGETFTPTEAATIILAYLKREAAKTLNDEVNDAVITVPAYFGFQEIGEVKKAAIDAGLNPIAIIPEPTAAAIRYGLEEKTRQTICVVGLGGGTFDVTVLDVNFDKKLNKHIINPVNLYGDHYLGGDDFDNVIIDWMIQNGAKEYKNKSRLKYDAESARIDLAVLTETVVDSVYMPNPVVLHRYKYKELIQSKLDRIGEIIKNTVGNSIVDGSRIDMNDINHFIFVGDICKHPVVRDCILEITEIEASMVSFIDYDSVAEGAAALLPQDFNWEK